MKINPSRRQTENRSAESEMLLIKPSSKRIVSIRGDHVLGIFSHPIAGSFHFMVLFLFLFSLVHSGAEEALHVSGKIFLETFKRTSTGDIVTDTAKGAFDARTSGCGFNIRSARIGNPYKYVETGSADGKTIYTIFTLDKSGSMQVANGSVDEELTAIGLDSPFNAAVMLVYASKCYFDSGNKGKLKPVWFTATAFRGLYYQAIQLPFTMEWVQPEQRFPQVAFFMDDGIDREVADGNALFFSHPSTNHYEGVAAAGFTNCILLVVDVTNVANVQIPMKTTITRFCPRWDTPNIRELQTVERFTIVATSITTAKHNESFIPDVADKTRVTDYRFANEKPVLPRVAYDVSDRWLGKAEVQLIPNYKEALSSWRGYKAAELHSHRETGHSSKRAVIVVIMILIAGGVTAAVLFSRNGKLTTRQNK